MSRGHRHLCLMSSLVCATIRTEMEGRECRSRTDRQSFHLQPVSMWRQQKSLETGVECGSDVDEHDMPSRSHAHSGHERG
jgi:hypothetical protein